VADARPERPFRPDEILGADIYWLLEVDFAGRKWRWATEAIDIDDDDGDPVVYQGGLSVSVGHAMEMFSEEAPDPSVSINDLLMPAGVDIAELIEQGHSFERAPAELALWVSPRTYEQRWVRVRGVVSLPSYGSKDEAVAFSFEPDGLEDFALVPSPEQTISATTFGAASWVDYGKAYPLVYGSPGIGTSLLEEFSGGSPAMMIDNTSAAEKILVCGERTYLADGTADVAIINTTALDGQVFSLTTTTDLLGHTITIADVSAHVALTVNSGDKYWCMLNTDTALVEGGIPNRTGDGVMEGAGEVSLDLLNRSTGGADRDRFRALESRMNRYKLAFYLDTPTSPKEIVERWIMPLLPCSLVAGPDGLYPVWWDRDASSSDAVAALNTTLGLDRVGPVQYERSQVANEIRIGFAPRSDDGQSYKWKTITGRDVGADSADVWPSLYSRISRARYGERTLSITTSVVYDEGTAGAILSWMSRAYAFPWRSVAYASTSGAHGYLQVGDVVTITDSEISLSERVAIVRDVQWDDADVMIGLLLIDDPVRDARST